MVESHNYMKKPPLRNKGFHIRYNELCKLRNSFPLPEVKAKNKNLNVLDFHADRIKTDDWLSILNSLYHDKTLGSIAVRLRKNIDNVSENVDTEKKARAFKNRPVILTKFIFTGFIEAIANCIENNTNINTLILEGLPLIDKYIISIAKSLSQNETIKSLSFARSFIADTGCEIICSTIKHLPNIESLNLSQCALTVKGAESVANLIKFQKIYRYSEGWKQSLRYRDVNPDSIPGLRRVSLNGNSEIGDSGAQLIAEVLKEDVWIKAIDMEECGLTDVGARQILECIEINKTIIIFDIKSNPGISDHLTRHINVQLGGEQEDYDGTGTIKSISLKLDAQMIKEKIKFLEQQLAAEIYRRKQTETLYEQLHDQMMECQKKISEQNSFVVPEGCTLVQNETLHNFLKEHEELKIIAATATKRDHRTISTISSTSKLRKHRIRKAKSETYTKNRAEYHRQKNNTKSATANNMPSNNSSNNNNNKNGNGNNECKNKNYKITKSESGIPKISCGNQQQHQQQQSQKPTYVEKNIGDTILQQSNRMLDYFYDDQAKNNIFMGMDALKIFVKNKSTNQEKSASSRIQALNPQTLFMGSEKLTKPEVLSSQDEDDEEDDADAENDDYDTSYNHKRQN